MGMKQRHVACAPHRHTFTAQIPTEAHRLGGVRCRRYWESPWRPLGPIAEVAFRRWDVDVRNLLSHWASSFAMFEQVAMESLELSCASTLDLRDLVTLPKSGSWASLTWCLCPASIEAFFHRAMVMQQRP